MPEEEREKRRREREKAEINKKKESHLKRMDDMKRLMIQDIMRRGNAFDMFQPGTAGCQSQIEYYEQICFGLEEK